MAVPVRVEKLSIEEFIRLYDQEGPFEIINGERIARMPPTLGHSYFVHLLYKLISSYLQSADQGEVLMETTFVLPDADPDREKWVKGSRIPDLMFYEKNRLSDYRDQVPDWTEKPCMMVPDWVIEVVSKNDSYSEIDQKVEAYLRDGVRLIWVVDPEQKKITVFQGNERRSYTQKDQVTGGEVLPGFTLEVGSLFG